MEWRFTPYFISSNRFIFVDVTAGPIVTSTDLENHNIHNSLPYDYAFGRIIESHSLSDKSLKLDMVAVTTRHLLENILFPNIVNNIHLHSRHMLTIPIVFFITSDSYTPRGMALQQEMEEVRASIRSLFKTHFRSKRVTLLTEFVYLQNNITLVNAIRSTFIESVVLFNQNNSVAYKTIKHIVGEALQNYL